MTTDLRIVDSICDILLHLLMKNISELLIALINLKDIFKPDDLLKVMEYLVEIELYSFLIRC